MDGFVSHLIDHGGPVALAVSAQLGERAVKFGRVAYMGPIVCESRLVYLLGGVPCSESVFGNGQEILLKRP